MSKKKPSMQPMAVAMALTNRKQNAAILFHDLSDFFAHSTETHQEKKVLRLSHEDMGCRTGLHIDQVKRGWRFLKEQRLVVTDVKKDYKYHKGHTTCVIHIPDEVMALREKLLQGNVQICTVGSEYNRIGQFVQGCTLPIYITEKCKSKTTPDSTNQKQESSNQKEKKPSKIMEMFGNAAG